MEDETGSVATEEFVGLKPKMYSCVVDDGRENKKQTMWIKYYYNNVS